MSYAEHSGHVHYVTARDGSRTALLVGPFRTRQEAEALEDAARTVVRERFAHDIHATFAEIGTSRMVLPVGRYAPAGKLNGLVDAADALGVS